MVAWISSDYFESLLLPQLLRGENDSKQSDEFQAKTMVVVTRNLVDLGEGKKYKYNAQNTSRVAKDKLTLWTRN